MQRLSTGWLLAMMALGLAGCSDNTAAPPIMIGHVTTLHGADKPRGESSMRGIQLALQQWNKESPLEQPVIILHADAANSKAGYEAEAVRLARINNALALLGGRTVAQVAGLEHAAVPVLSPCGTHTVSMSTRVYLTGLAPTCQGQMLARFALQRWQQMPCQPRAIGKAIGSASLPSVGPVAAAADLAGQKTALPRLVVLLDERRDEFTAAADAFVQEFTTQHSSPSKGGSLIFWRYQDEKELEARLERLPAEEPAAVLLAGDTEAVWRLRSHKELAHLPILFAGEVGSDSVLAASRLTKDNIYLVTPWTADVETAQNKAFVQAFQKEFQRLPDVHAALAYDNARLLLAALSSRPESVSSAALQEYWNNLKDFPGLTGPMSLSAHHTLQRPAFLVHLRQGELVRQELRQPDKK